MKVLNQTSIYKEKVTFKRNYESISTMVNIYLNKYHMSCLKSIKLKFNDVYKVLDLYFDTAT